MDEVKSCLSDVMNPPHDALQGPVITPAMYEAMWEADDSKERPTVMCLSYWQL